MNNSIYDADGQVVPGLPWAAYAKHEWGGEWPVCRLRDGAGEPPAFADLIVEKVVTSEPLPYPLIYHCEGFILNVADADRLEVSYDAEDVAYPNAHAEPDSSFAGRMPI